MSCPECKEPLIIYELDGIEIDHCLECHGIWLDAGELEALSRLRGVQPGRLSDALDSAGKRRLGARRCPRCNSRLDLIRVDAATPVEIDHCPRGHGLWFDRGELRAALMGFADSDAGTDAEESAVARFLGDLYRDELTSDSH